MTPVDLVDDGAMASSTDQLEAEFRVTENRPAGRFELWHRNELVGYARYHQDGDVIVVPHVETVAHLRGNGYGARLMDGLLAIIAADGRTITALCPFAAEHIRANPDHHPLVAG